MVRPVALLGHTMVYESLNDWMIEREKISENKIKHGGRNNRTKNILCRKWRIGTCNASRTIFCGCSKSRMYRWDADSSGIATSTTVLRDMRKTAAKKQRYHGHSLSHWSHPARYPNQEPMGILDRISPGTIQPVSHPATKDNHSSAGRIIFWR